jgi:Uma2 family endonuclease
VTCDRRDDPTLTYTNFPTLIIEVLSSSTKGFDRRNKFEFYQTIPTLQTYLLIDAEKYRLDCFRRQTEDIWTVQFYKDKEAIAHLGSLEINAPLTEIYEGVDFPESSL